MAFVETRSAAAARTVLDAVGVCRVALCATSTTNVVYAGDSLGIDTNSEWDLSAHASGEQPLLVALESGVGGDTISAALMALIEVTTTSTNVATLGEEVALKDTGEYQATGAGLPDVGFVVSVGSDSLSAILCICPSFPQLTTARA